MQNQHQKADVVTVVVPALTTYAEGQLVVRDGLVGIVAIPHGYTGAAGDEVELHRRDGWSYAKAAGVAFTMGEPVYLDETADELTNDPDGNPLVGVAIGNFGVMAEAADVEEFVALIGDAAALASGAEGTDTFGYLFVEGSAFEAVSGTWAQAAGSNANRVGQRTAAATSEVARYRIPLPTDTRDGRGLRVLSYAPIYAIDTADFAVDVRFELQSKASPADGAGMAAPTALAGAVDAHYDADHDTAAKRADDTGAPEYHTALVTVPTPAFVADGESLFVDVIANDTGGGTADLDVYGIGIYYERR